jgi:BirA family biotin operon repressor/biotin-[acetyl-CoA-carboxylase] ligase
MSLQHLGPINHFSEIDSTNRYLADEARKGAASGLVAVADHQTAGRGRLGRKWEAPQGANLLMSVLLRPDQGVAPFHFTAATALAAADACKVVAGVKAGLKWPNDLVVADQGKLAGILAEFVTATRPQRDAVVVGLGLNVNWFPPHEELIAEKRECEKRPLRATSLAQLTDRPVNIDELLTEVLEHLDRRIADLCKPGGPIEQMKEYRSRSVLIGEMVLVDTADGTVQGIVADISDDGHLVVTCNHPKRNRQVNKVFTTGDVSGVGTIRYRPLTAGGPVQEPDSSHPPAT